MKVLIAEPLAAAGIELFQSQPGWEVIVSNPKEYAQHLAEADALLVRSAVQVDQSVLEKAPKLRVIGRAGVGVDNVDLEAATQAGVLVMNTPGGNAISVAEHTLAMMLAMARHIPQANASTRGGKWEKKKFMGNELRGKTLGIVGLGSIGREVVKRARAFEMRIVAHDPYVTSNIAHDLGVELLDLPKLYAASDYLTLHVASTPETQGMLSREAFRQMKDGVRIVNCARGELVDEAALVEALASGKVADVSLDVFSVEPPPAGFALFASNGVLATPHIGGSTEEAQEIVGVRIAEQRGWEVVERHDKRSVYTDSIRIDVETDSGVTSVEGAVVLGMVRLLQVDGIYCEAALSGYLIVMKNQDVPGVIGHVGTVLGRNNINIANFSLGRREGTSEAVALVSTDGLVPESVLAQLKENPAVKFARSVEFRA